MKNKAIKWKFLVFMLITLMMVSPIAAGTYSLPEADVGVVVHDDATATITQKIVYDINGTINGVYYDMPLSGEQNVTNITVETPGFYNEVEKIWMSDRVRFKVWLYKDANKTQQVSDTKVAVTYKYDFIKGVKVYDDVAELHFAVWGTNWDSKVAKLTTHITLPGPINESAYWFNPPNIVESKSLNGNTMTATYSNLDPYDENIEQRTLMPKTYFKSFDNADVIAKNAKDNITQMENDYYSKVYGADGIQIIIIAICLILIAAPFIIYYKYGREYKLKFNSKYETDIPYDDSPAYVNAMMNENCGDLNINAFQATIMDLIDKRFIRVFASEDNNLIIKIDVDKYNEECDELWQYEVKILDFLYSYRRCDDTISFRAIKNSMANEDFIDFFNSWKSLVRDNEDIWDEADEKFDDTGSIYAEIVSIASIIFAFIAFVVSLCTGSIYFFTGLELSVVLFIEGLIVRALPDEVMGSYTYTGREYKIRWEHFRNYIKNYSLIKEYPPESVQVWGRYLVYATALGCADKVQSNMKKYFDEYNIPENSDVNVYSNPVYLFATLGGAYVMLSAFDSLVTPPHSESNYSSGGGFDGGSFGDIGDIGGGFGGGGGGVF